MHTPKSPTQEAFAYLRAFIDRADATANEVVRLEAERDKQKARADRAEAEAAKLREALEAVRSQLTECPYPETALPIIEKALAQEGSEA